MCTVTYAPTAKGFIFTSNRDEQAKRTTIPPAYYKEDGEVLFYPKDKLAGGTWIGVTASQRLVCLLNGGFVYHNPVLKFPRSRGVIVKEILTAKDVESKLRSLNLEGVAPFTLVVVDWKNYSKAYELVWCKQKKHVTTLDVTQPYIWSSSTLYTQEMKIERKKWFAQEVLSVSETTKQQVLAFHQNESLGNSTTSPKMKRDVVETVSTTMVVQESNTLSMEYFDYVEGKEFCYSRLFSEVNV